MLRFASLASGSKGNCLVAEAGSTRVLIDCGLGPRKMAQRLGMLGVEPRSISALLITHEHDDHAGGAWAFALAHGVPMWMTRGTHRALAQAGMLERSRGPRQSGDTPSPAIRFLDGRSAIEIGDMQVQPFTVPHDAAEPVQYRLSDGSVCLGVLTDLGVQTPHVVEVLSGCHGLVLECNHELEMLWASDYPRWLKERISGPLGHIDNSAAARLLASLDRSRLQHVIAAHLSIQNNTRDAARRALASAMNCSDDWIGLAEQDSGFSWRDLS